MRNILIGLALVLTTSAAVADPAYTITNMSCAEVQAALRAKGSAILHYRSNRSPGLPLYSRYVSDSRFCDPGETAAYASVPAKDKKDCTVRKCKSVF
jgi:hypothetical protein